MHAILRRAFYLGLVDAAQDRSANIQRVRARQAKAETYEDRIGSEEPGLPHAAVCWPAGRDQVSLQRLLVEPGMAPGSFARLTGKAVPALSGNAVRFRNADWRCI